MAHSVYIIRVNGICSLVILNENEKPSVYLIRRLAYKYGFTYYKYKLGQSVSTVIETLPEDPSALKA